MSDKSKEKIYVMGVEFPSNEEMEEFDKELIKKLEESSKDLVEVINYEETDEDYKLEDFTESNNSSLDIDYLRYNSEGKILISSLPE